MTYKRSRRRLTNLYLGKQSDLNTAATTFGHALTGATLDYVPVEERDEYEDVIGRPTMAGRAFTPEPVRHLTNVTQGGRFDFSQILAGLNCGIGKLDPGGTPSTENGAVVETPTNATDARKWTWSPLHDKALPIEYVTAHWSERSADKSVTHKRAAKGFCTSIKIGRPETGQCTMETMWQFGRSKDTSDGPGTVTIPPVLSVPTKIVGAKIFDTYADAESSTRAGLGSNDICDIEFTLGTGHAITERMSNVEDLDYDDEDAGDHAYMVSGTMYADVRSTGLDVVERSKKNDKRFFRMDLVSTKPIETTTVAGTDYTFNYYFSIILCAIYTGESFEGRAQYDDQGRRKLSFEAHGYPDETSNVELEIILTTNTGTFA